MRPPGRAVRRELLQRRVRLVDADHHEAAQVLRHFMRPVRPRGKGRRVAQPTTREDTPEAREAAERMAALLMEEEQEDLVKAVSRSDVVSGGRVTQWAVSSCERLPTQRMRGVS